MPSTSITPAARVETLFQECKQHVARPATPADATAWLAQIDQLTALCATLRPEAEVFGLDRIQNLEVTARPFASPPDFEAATHFTHYFGITRLTDGVPPAEILLRFAPVQGRCVLSYPLQASQQVVAATAHDDKIDVRLTVYDNHDLSMELLSYGPEVEVLAPPALREWLRAQHSAASRN